MPSDFPQDADKEGHPAGFTRHCPSSHFPLSRLIRLSCVPGNFPGRMDGGVLAQTSAHRFIWELYTIVPKARNSA